MARKNKSPEPNASGSGSPVETEVESVETETVLAAEVSEAPEQKFPGRDLICGMEPKEYFEHMRLMTQHSQDSHLEILARNHPEVAALLKERNELREQLNKITAG